MEEARRPLLAAGLVAAMFAPGCFAPLMKVQARAAIEQQVVSVAVQRAVDRLVVDPSIDPSRYRSGVRVAVSAPADVDDDVVTQALERRLHLLEIPVVRDGEVLLPTFEAAVSFAGSDTQSGLLGLPLIVPGFTTSLGELSIYRSESQIGRARIGLQIWDPHGRLVDVLPEKEASCFFKNETFLMVFGAFVATDMEDYEAPAGGSIFGGDGRL